MAENPTDALTVVIPIRDDIPVGEAYEAALRAIAEVAEKYGAAMDDDVSIRSGTDELVGYKLFTATGRAAHRG